MESPTPFQKWYTSNRAEYNAARRKRYHRDKSYRSKALEYARKQTLREAAARPKRAGMTINAAAIQIGRTAATIRRWEKQKLIPKSRDDRGYRVYTKRQVSLLKKLGAVQDGLRYSRVTVAQAQKVRAMVKEQWHGS